MSVKLSNIPTMSVGEAVDTLTAAFEPIINARLPMSCLPSVMLWGPPGVGKSQAIRQIGERLFASTGKKCVITDVRLLLFNPIDLRGIPTANADKTLAVWLRPKIFDMDPSERIINILFLDEISAAPQSVQAAAYQITLDRVVGEHKLPDNCIVIAAGNRVTDKSVAFKMPRALANRLCHIEIESSFDSFSKWAVASSLDPRVLGFLSFRPDYLNKSDGTDGELAFATPRSWEMVSKLLSCTKKTADELRPLISGCVGVGIGVEFCSWCKAYASLPSIKDIFAGRRVTLPTDTDILYALISAMTAYASEHRSDMGGIANSISFAMGMPPDFAAVLLKNYMAIEPGFKEKLMKIPDFYKFISKKGRLLNGI